jgi:ubiquitin-conjugating enzyme E2 W
MHTIVPAKALANTQQELSKLHEHIAPGIILVSAEDLKQWIMDIRVLDDNPIYKDQVYRLKFSFSNSYPIGVSSRLLL